MSNCQDRPTFFPEALWKALMNLPALRYMKAPVFKESDLYKEYPTGNEWGTFAYVHEANTFYIYHPRGRYAKRWRPISADSVSSFFEIDPEFLKEGDILMYDSTKQKFVVKSGNVWNKLIGDLKDTFSQVTKFLNQVDEIPTDESDSGIYFVHKDEDNTAFRALYIVLGKKSIKIFNSSDYWNINETQIELAKKANQTQVNDVAASVDVLAVTKAEKSVVDALMNGIIKQPGVDTYNDTSEGKTSLASVYGLTSSNNGTNGSVKQSGWDVLVREDETKGGKSNRYNWNGSMWVDMETGNYDENVATKDDLVQLEAGIEDSANATLLNNTLNLTVKKSIMLLNGSIVFNNGFGKYSVSDFIPIYTLRGSAIKGLLTWKTAQAYPIAFFTENKTIIGQAYTNIDVDTETKTDIVVTDALLANYPNVAYARLGTSSDFVLSITSVNTDRQLSSLETKITSDTSAKLSKKEDIVLLSSAMFNSDEVEFADATGWDMHKSPFLDGNGVYRYYPDAEGWFYVTKPIPIKGIKKIHYSGRAQNNVSAVVIYDSKFNKLRNFAGTSASIITELDVVLDNNTDYYVRCSGDVRYPLRLTIVGSSAKEASRGVFVDLYSGLSSSNDQIIQINTKIASIYPSYKFNMFLKAIFGGDSTTKGFVVEGTADQQYIYQEMPESSYPVQFGKIHPNIEITIKAQTGINCINWLATIYPTIDFSLYDLFVLELGLNGQLNIADIDTPGTNTYCYKQAVAGARAQNPDLTIVLVRSSHFGAGWVSAIEAVAGLYNCIYVDLHDTTYINLDDAKYHGYDLASHVFDWAHFTRKGYNAKAYAVSRLLADKLSESTQYI